MSPTSPRVALMVARTWLEGLESMMRVQVRWSLDVTGGFDGAATFADVDSTCAQVRRCLEQALSAGDGPVTGP